MFNEFLERLFQRSKDKNSRSEVKRRLKLLLAHDRADLSPALVESMQQEILEVISRYVELDTEGMSFALESDRRTTSLTANFPILRVKDDSEEGSSIKTDEVKTDAGEQGSPIETEEGEQDSSIELESSEPPESADDTGLEMSADTRLETSGEEREDDTGLEMSADTRLETSGEEREIVVEPDLNTDSPDVTGSPDDL